MWPPISPSSRSDARVPERGLTSTRLFLSPKMSGVFLFLSVDELYGLLCDGVVMNPDEGFLDGEDGGWDGGPADFFVAGGPPRGDREGEPSQDENDRFADA